MKNPIKINSDLDVFSGTYAEKLDGPLNTSDSKIKTNRKR